MLKGMSKPIVLIFILCAMVFGEEPVDLQAIQKIKEEGIKNSKVMETVSYITDVYGPRLTGSPDLREAAEWTIKQLNEWGIKRSILFNNNSVKAIFYGPSGTGKHFQFIC